jgi:hypothetical protein
MARAAVKFYASNRELAATARQLGETLPHVGSAESASQIVALVSVVIQLLGTESAVKSGDKELVVRDIVQVVLSVLHLPRHEVLIVDTAVTAAMQTFMFAKAMYRSGLLQKLLCCCGGKRRDISKPPAATFPPAAIHAQVPEQ